MSEAPVVLVSGASRGLGGALARDLLGRGWAVTAFSRSRTPLVDELEREGGARFWWEKRIVRRTPLGRLGTVEEVVSVIRFLLSDDARFITDHTLVVDGGITC